MARGWTGWLSGSAVTQSDLGAYNWSSISSVTSASTTDYSSVVLSTNAYSERIIPTSFSFGTWDSGHLKRKGVQVTGSQIRHKCRVGSGPNPYSINRIIRGVDDIASDAKNSSAWPEAATYLYIPSTASSIDVWGLGATFSTTLVCHQDFGIRTTLYRNALTSKTCYLYTLELNIYYTDPATPASAGIGSPANGAVNVSVSTAVTWHPKDAITESYDVYFGTNSTPSTIVLSSTTNTSYDPTGDLLNNTTYYWKVNTKNISGTTIGSIWSFTTIAAVAGTVIHFTPNINYTSISATIGASINKYLLINTSLNSTTSQLSHSIDRYLSTKSYSTSLTNNILSSCLKYLSVSINTSSISSESLASFLKNISVAIYFQSLSPTDVNTLIDRNLVINAKTTSLTSTIQASILRQLSAIVSTVSVTSIDVVGTLTKFLNSLQYTTSLTSDSLIGLVKSISSNNFVTSTTSDNVSYQIIRGLVINSLITSVTNSITNISVLRKLNSLTFAESLTSDIEISLSGLKLIRANLLTSSMTANILTQVLRQLNVNTSFISNSPDINSIITKNLSSAPYATSLSNDLLNVSVTKTLNSYLHGTSLTNDAVNQNINRYLSGKSYTTSLTGDITIAVQGVINFLTRIYSTSLSGSLDSPYVHRELFSNPLSTSLTNTIDINYLKRIIANISVDSISSDITAILQTVKNIQASIGVSSISGDVGLPEFIRALSSYTHTNSLTNTIEQSVLRLLSSNISFESLTSEITLASLVLGLIESSSIESATTSRSAEVEQTINSIISGSIIRAVVSATENKTIQHANINVKSIENDPVIYGLISGTVKRILQSRTNSHSIVSDTTNRSLGSWR